MSGKGFVLPCLALVGGCGRVNFAPLDTDVRATDGPSTDACAFGPWSAPQRLVAISSGGNDWGGQISADGLDFYFASDRTGNFDLYESHRSDRTQSFTTIAAITSINGSGRDDDISVTPDGLDVYFGSDQNPMCILHASRAQKSDAFSNIGALATCGSAVATGPYITPDGLSLYYNTGPSVGAPWGTLLVATRGATSDTFGAGAPITSLEGGETKGFPALSADELTIYFENGSPNHHLAQATRPDRASDFGAPIPVPGINDTDIDEDASITADGRELYFASRRTGTANADIFMSTRACM